MLAKMVDPPDVGQIWVLVHNHSLPTFELYRTNFCLHFTQSNVNFYMILQTINIMLERT